MSARPSGAAQASNKESAQEGSGVLADFAFGHVGQEDLALVHNPPQIKDVVLAGQNSAKKGIREKRSYFILNPRNGFGSERG